MGLQHLSRQLIAALAWPLPRGASPIVQDQSAVGLDRLTPEEYEQFKQLNAAYRKTFGFPVIVCVRENTKETILASARARLAHNSRTQEMATTLVEGGKIANLRLQDLIEQPFIERCIPVPGMKLEAHERTGWAGNTIPLLAARCEP